LADVAREFSPRIDAVSEREVVLDLRGLERLFGDARTIAEELRRTAADRGIRVRVAVAGTRTATRLLVRHRAGLTVIEPGTEAMALASLPISVLGEFEPGDATSRRSADESHRASKAEELAVGGVLRRWGVRTLGEFAALPGDEIASRLGQDGVAWQRLARGGDPAPLVPSAPEERFAQALELEWPIEELEPLSFVLSRLMEPLSAHLERRDRGAAVLHVRLHLVKLDATTPDVHERSLQLPAPMRDARTLRTLALLDLESNPPPAPIDRVEVAVDPTPGRIVQYSLLTRALPTPERVSTLMARLHALMGETRCGSPALVDSWRPEAFEMRAFAPVDTNVIHRRHDTPRHRGIEGMTHRGSEALSVQNQRPTSRRTPEKTPRYLGASVCRSSVATVPQCVVTSANDASKPPHLALRRFRLPIPARVRVCNGQPEYVAIDRRGLTGGGIESCAGPWRTAGDWWRQGWDRDEWDVTVAGGTTYRVFRARDTDRWFVEGVVD
jgi:protein ImuB